MTEEKSNQQDILIQVQPTPNPNAWKFILDKPVLNEGKATYVEAEEAQNNTLASALFQIEGIRQVHFFQNVITITHNFDAEVEPIHEAVVSVIQTRMPIHNPNQTKFDEKKIARSSLSPELQQIEEILDRTVRPGLQGDGGDITVARYEDNKLYVYYEGACGTCPSSTSGTLMAIEGILKDEFNPQIEVIPS
jgi:Fe-S cluster biogenesis protein NfuA